MSLNTHYYHALTRKYITAFGNVFNNFTLKRYNKAMTAELEQIKVPILYSPKEGYVYALNQDSDKSRAAQIVLPAMSFEMTGINYDASRKHNTIIKNYANNSSVSSHSQYIGVPYDLAFSLNIFARNIDDALQIVEQILPLFTPDFNISVNLLAEFGTVRDIPIILGSVNQPIDYEGNFEKTRYIVWTLDFTMKVNFYGPINTSKLIRTVYANTYLDPSLSTGYIIRANMDEGNNGDYKLNDIVYQGRKLSEATAAAIVIDWNKETANTGKLQLGGVQGNFVANSKIHSASTNAAYTLSSVDVTPLKLVSQKTTPDPSDADPTDPYGFLQTTIEYPETLD